MSDPELAAIPVEKDEREQLWANLGEEFEDRVVQALCEKESVLRPGKGQKLSERMSLGFLMGKLSEKYAAQLNLQPSGLPSTLRSSGIELRRTYPDLIRVDRPGDVPVFTVIDIKATRHATAFHKTQVAYYVRMLEAVLKEKSISAELSNEGEIWRIPDNGSAEGSAYQIDIFNISPYLRMVDDFCTNALRDIISKNVDGHRDETFFHIYFKCEQCAFLSHCETSIGTDLKAQDRDISAVPGLTHEGKRSLQRFGIRKVGQLSKAEGLAQLHGASWSLQRRARSLRERAVALIDDEPQRSFEEHTYLMPPRVDSAFFVIADHDPVDDTLVTLGFSVVEGAEVSRKVRVIRSGDRKAEADALFEVLRELIVRLGAIDLQNRNSSPEEQRRAHIFFYEGSEAANLHRAVARHLDDRRIREGLIHIVRLFPPEDVVPEPEFRGAHHLPATVLRNVVEQLYALPVMVAYDLHQVSTALRRAGKIEVAYEPKPLFARPFSALLALDISRGLREGKMRGFSEADIEADVFGRLATTEQIAEWLFKEDEGLAKDDKPRLLRLKKHPFKFHESFDPLNADDLDILQALELLENRAGMLDSLIALAQSSDRRRDAGRCIAGMRLISSSNIAGKGPPQKRLVFEVPSDSRDSDIQSGNFGLILTDNDPDVRLDPVSWKDCSVSYWPPLENERPDRLTLSINRARFESDVFSRMFQRSSSEPVWHLDKSFFDVNSERAARFIGNLVRGSAA